MYFRALVSQAIWKYYFNSEIMGCWIPCINPMTYCSVLGKRPWALSDFGLHGRLPRIKFPYIWREAATLTPWNGVPRCLLRSVRFYGTLRYMYNVMSCHVMSCHVLYYRKWRIIILYTTKDMTFFSYSPCPNLEGIKEVLSYKFRRLTIGQNCCAVCTNEGVM